MIAFEGGHAGPSGAGETRPARSCQSGRFRGGCGAEAWLRNQATGLNRGSGLVATSGHHQERQEDR